MVYQARNSEWVSLRRSLAILRQLMQGPATTDELAQAVERELGQPVYSLGAAGRAAFKHDKEKLKSLGADFVYDPRNKTYNIIDPGPWGYLDLSPASLKALRLLYDTFESEFAERTQVQPLLDELIGRLSPENRRRLETNDLPVSLELFQSVEASPLNEQVWEVVNRATREHRKLAFNYLSPQYLDRIPHYHEVAPVEIRYKQGHWYLHAYDLYSRGLDIQGERNRGYRNFRLHYILSDDSLVVLPTVLPHVLRKPPRYGVHYRLMPPLSRGFISRRFTDMEITYLPNDSVEITGYTDNDWEAARILLAYGENCIVLGGEEVLGRVRKAVKGMSQYYE